MYTPEKSLPGSKGIKNQIIIFTQFLPNNQCCLTRNSSNNCFASAKFACSSTKSLWNNAYYELSRKDGLVILFVQFVQGCCLKTRLIHLRAHCRKPN